MTAPRYFIKSRLRRTRKNLAFERFMAIVVTFNFLIILFDLTYVPLRNFWLLGRVKLPLIERQVPIPLPPPGLCTNPGEMLPDQATLITQCYDWIKGIEPHRDTETYLATVNQLQQQLQQRGGAALQAPETQALLQELGQMSREMIDTNPFEAVNKSGTLEKIKNQMRNRVGPELSQLTPEELAQANISTARTSASRRRASATASFQLFWSPIYLTPANWQQEMRWFNQTIRPLMQTNYYRSISENGGFTNNFWKIDLPFWLLFVAEFLARTYYLSRRYIGVSWLDTMIWRWYDWPLIVPFGWIFTSWAWLRILPTGVRLHQAELVDFSRLQRQTIQGIVSQIGEEMTDLVVLHSLNQLQAAVQREELMHWFLRPRSGERITVNNIDEIAEITGLMIKMTVYQILPKVQPDLEVLVQNSVASVLHQSPAFLALQKLPGLGPLSMQLTNQLVTDVIQSIYTSLTAILDDTKNLDLAHQLVQNFSVVMGQEIQQKEVLKELQSLLIDFLEEIKLNYIQQSQAMDISSVIEESRQLHQGKVDRSRDFPA